MRSPTSVTMRQGLASLSGANRQEDSPPSNVYDDINLNILCLHKKKYTVSLLELFNSPETTQERTFSFTLKADISLKINAIAN